MKINSKNQSCRNGATMILMMFLLVVVFVFVAFAIDVGRIQLAQLKLQTAADFSARAGAEALSRGVADQSDLPALETAIRNEADMLMRENNLFGMPITFDANAQISFGFADSSEDSQVVRPLGGGTETETETTETETETETETWRWRWKRKRKRWRWKRKWKRQLTFAWKRQKEVPIHAFWRRWAPDDRVKFDQCKPRHFSVPARVWSVCWHGQCCPFDQIDCEDSRP